MNQSDSTPFNWKEFSQRTWVVVVSGLVFPPLGIFLSWRKTDWAPKAKWIATGLMGLLFLGQIGARERKDGTESGATPAARVVSANQSSPSKATQSGPTLRAYYDQGYQQGKLHGEQMRHNVENAYTKSNQRARGERMIREVETAYEGHVKAVPDWRKETQEEKRGVLDGFRAGSR